MRELDAILDAWRRDRHARGVLATVVHVEGSAYRRPGARMWIGADGKRIGSISGGCLESDVSKKAAWWTSGGQPVVRVYDTSAEDDAVWEFGLGCNGVITVLLEPVEAGPVQAMFEYLSTRQRKGAVMATVIRAAETNPTRRVGERWFGEVAAIPELNREMEAAARRQSSRMVHLPGGEDVWIEWIGPAPRLVVLGAGHDARPVTELAAMLGWRTTVADGRPAYARRECFPGAEEVQVIPPDGDLSALGLNADCAVVLMTHNYPQDRKLLPQILAAGPRYLGMLGPRKRAERLFEELGIEARDWDIHAPVGLDIGSEDPETVALAIVSEIQATLTGRGGGRLRERAGKIHDDPEERGERRRAPAAEERATVGSCETREVRHD